MNPYPYPPEDQRGGGLQPLPEPSAQVPPQGTPTAGQGSGNPYAAPQAPVEMPYPRQAFPSHSGAVQPSEELFAPCPECGCPYADRVRFTFWGGAVGPWLFDHVRCRNCGACYHGKRGTSNTGNIVIYTVVTGLIAVAILVVCFAYSDWQPF